MIDEDGQIKLQHVKKQFNVLKFQVQSHHITRKQAPQFAGGEGTHDMLNVNFLQKSRPDPSGAAHLIKRLSNCIRRKLISNTSSIISYLHKT